MAERVDNWENITILPDEMAGVWANRVRITRSEYEFTIDFARVDFASEDQEGILVARVAIGPLLLSTLTSLLDDQWESYAEQAFPREVDDG
jgi:hypothetical protein